MGAGSRWLEVTPVVASAVLVLASGHGPDQPGVDAGPVLEAPDIIAAHAVPSALGVVFDSPPPGH